MYFITVSEMLGTGGEEIARGVAETLHYSYCGEEELFRAADEMGFLSDVKRLDEKGPHFFERFFTEKPRVYLDRLQSLIYELAKKGDAVFFGRGSQLLLHSFHCALHVLVTGSLQKRVERVIKEKGVGREIAEKMIRRSDHDKEGFIRYAFDEDWLNPNLYDLILNTDKLSIPSAIKSIVESARSDEIKACGVDSVKILGKLSLHRRIESALLEAGFMPSRLFFEVEDEEWVRLYGVANSSEEKEEIERIVKGMKGVKRVTNDLIVMKAAMGGA
ncbi:MAG: cytidylate kinase family protein [Syntrophaceae bacterium]|nr:cytidylate kinase family protein [Syntrophaceae bacterium]